ncbi:AP2-associated protein kinase 1-like [Cocos nucifera]|uniref:non-specific serine/threonine protein kinase n=1 Tax=Cocos nucifera TaxID=13894 RepID=A0A8K0HUM2_COCNU|nr:AP2-associated protein kinase 1-like [Cocos nucifera]
MWRFKQFMPKEQAGLEGRTVEVGSLKVHVRNVIAEGGFSCVYLARDAVNSSKQYALKHVICQDGESLELVMKEISVMKLLKGHPNVVMLVAHTILDMGRTKEALLVMEFCEKSLVTVLENRGAGYFEEKKILLIFRDVCNAVFAMHCQSPPIAHRDLKAENVLLGADGAWKLCDFGSTSTNHKCFNRPEEMGIEEDNIRKHTTPAYRAPEMWDLYRREVISEKVDIWALGCLLYRICYFKSAFDGESKLQILNGNYRIPELPKYSASVTSLIKDMLEASPDARPDITQVWFRVNELLPAELQEHLPDGSPSASNVDICPPVADVQDEGVRERTLAMPRRSPPPPPPSREHIQNTSRSSTSKVAGDGGQLGAFWTSQHVQDLHTEENKGPIFDKEPANKMASKHNRRIPENRASPPKEQHLQRSVHRNSPESFDAAPADDFEIRFSPGGSEQGLEKTRASDPDGKASFQNKAFNAFVAEFDTSKHQSANVAGNINNKSILADKGLEAELFRLKEELKQVSMEKEEITSKYEKLSAICRSQRQEIQELKRALAATISSPAGKDSSKAQASPGSTQSDTPPREKIGSVWELQQGMSADSPATPSPDPKPWQPFAEEPKVQSTPKSIHPRSVRTVRAANGGRDATKQTTTYSANEPWGFDDDSFRAIPSGSGVSGTSVQGNTSQRFGGGGETKKGETSQPAGWAGF